MARPKPKQPSVRLLDHAILDEGGRRWDFDFGIGWRSDVAVLIGEVQPVRVLAGHYADTRDVPVDALGRIDGDAQAGVYRAGTASIVYIAE